MAVNLLRNHSANFLFDVFIYLAFSFQEGSEICSRSYKHYKQNRTTKSSMGIFKGYASTAFLFYNCSSKVLLLHPNWVGCSTNSVNPLHVHSGCPRKWKATPPKLFLFIIVKATRRLSLSQPASLWQLKNQKIHRGGISCSIPERTVTRYIEREEKDWLTMRISQPISYDYWAMRRLSLQGS